MSYKAEALNVLIASPGDVASERQICHDVVHEWNAVHSSDRSIVLMPIAWELSASPAAGDRPQAIINDQLVNDADIVIGIFWTRLGTPTGLASSGTVEEIEKHIVAEGPALIYFSTAPVAPASVDREQYEKLIEFKNSLQSRALLQTYESDVEFERLLTRQLAQTVIRKFPRDSGGHSEPISSGKVDAVTNNLVETYLDISPKAKELLITAFNDPDGAIVRVRHLNGVTISIGQNEYASKGERPTESKLWWAAVDELVEHSLLKRAGGDKYVYRLTSLGVRTAQALAPPPRASYFR